MGGEQSHETKEREEEKQEVSAGPDGSGPAASEGSASEGIYSDTVGESNWVYHTSTPLNVRGKYCTFH